MSSVSDRRSRAASRGVFGQAGVPEQFSAWSFGTVNVTTEAKVGCEKWARNFNVDTGTVNNGDIAGQFELRSSDVSI